MLFRSSSHDRAGMRIYKNWDTFMAKIKLNKTGKILQNKSDTPNILKYCNYSMSESEIKASASDVLGGR